eukprot:359724-Chlamydomonas_euryale.AAC.4
MAVAITGRSSPAMGATSAHAHQRGTSSIQRSRALLTTNETLALHDTLGQKCEGCHPTPSPPSSMPLWL